MRIRISLFLSLPFSPFFFHPSFKKTPSAKDVRKALCTKTSTVGVAIETGLSNTLRHSIFRANFTAFIFGFLPHGTNIDLPPPAPVATKMPRIFSYFFPPSIPPFPVAHRLQHHWHRCPLWSHYSSPSVELSLFTSLNRDVSLDFSSSPCLHRTQVLRPALALPSNPSVSHGPSPCQPLPSPALSP